MLEFLLALLTTATVAALLVPLVRPRTVPPTPRLDNDLAIYRDQLATIEQERTAGLVTEEEAQSATVEIQRRILAAADPHPNPPPQGEGREGVGRALPLALCLAIPLFALGIYLHQGHPGLPASPFASHSAPAPDARPDLPKLIAEMRARLDQNAADPEALSSLGELLVLEAAEKTGIPTVTPAARTSFEAALKLKPDDPRSGYYLGLAEAQAGDARAALARWQAIAAAAPAEAPYLAMLNAEIVRVAREANLPVPELKARGAPPEASAKGGPTREQVEQMGKLSSEEQSQAIRGMVDGLAARLRDNPTDRDGWLKLANARKVLGQADLSAEAFAKADALKPLDAPQLAGWAEALVRQLPAGGAPGPDAVAVLTRLEQAEPRNALALFYLGVADMAQGRKPDAARRWKMLLQMLPADAPIRGLLDQKIKEAE